MALPFSDRLLLSALVHGAGLSRQALGIRPWMHAFQVGGPRIHRAYGQGIQTHFDQETAMLRPPDQMPNRVHGATAPSPYTHSNDGGGEA